MATRFVLYDKARTIKRICNNDDIGMFVATTCARHMDEFVPMQTGMLSTNIKLKPFKVIYTQPYANKMFFGTHFHFSKEMHLNAGARWDKACSSVKSEVIAKEVEKYIASR